VHQFTDSVTSSPSLRRSNVVSRLYFSLGAKLSSSAASDNILYLFYLRRTFVLSFFLIFVRCPCSLPTLCCFSHFHLITIIVIISRNNDLSLVCLTFTRLSHKRTAFRHVPAARSVANDSCKIQRKMELSRNPLSPLSPSMPHSKHSLCNQDMLYIFHTVVRLRAMSR